MITRSIHRTLAALIAVTLAFATIGLTATPAMAVSAANADLSALWLSSGTLSPGFGSATTSYTASVGNATTSLTLTPTVADVTSTVTVNGVAVTSGNASGAIALSVGANTVTTIVTAQDGTTTKTYTVTITRAASATADLSALSLSSGTLSPGFGSATTSYTASVGNATTSLTLTPTVLSGTSSVTVNGVAVTSGNASGAIALSVGANTITTIVTAQNGTTTKTYTVTVTRAGEPVVEVTTDLVAGAPATGSTVTFTGVDLIPGSTYTVTMYSSPIVLATGTVGVDGVLDVTVTLPAGIEAGAHRVELDVTPPTGTPLTRAAWFTVLADGTIGAASLVGPVFLASSSPALAVTGVEASTVTISLISALLALTSGVWLSLQARRRSIAWFRG